MKKKIILHGYLADLYPQKIEVEATSVAEALRALTQIPELAKDGPHPVRIDGVDTEIALHSPTEMVEIHLHPRIGGAGGDMSSTTQIIIGIALVSLAIYNPAFLSFAGMSFQQSVFMTGALMVAGGAMQLLAPEPDDSDKQSYILGGDENTVALGTPIQLAYGFNKLGGHYLSFDVDAVKTSGESIVEEKPDASEINVVEHDKSAVPWATLLPRYDQSAAAPSNIPTSNWVNS